MSFKSVARNGFNSTLRPFGLQLVRGYSSDPAVRTFISARSTIARAKRAGLSVSDYIDQQNAEPGTTAATVDEMLRLAAFDGPVHRVCEIGPGSGRYSERVIDALHPEVYEAYETAPDWLPYLRGLPNVVTQPCDGRTLAHTATASVDLVHAHKVFVYLPFVTTVGYLDEMVRVVRPGGVVAFDIVTEDCLTEQTIKAWRPDSTLYLVTPRGWILNFLAGRGLSLLGSHFAALTGGLTELLVFRAG